MILVNSANDLFFGEAANSNPVIISTQVKILLIVVHIFDGMTVVTITMHHFRRILANLEKSDCGVIATHTYHTALFRKTYRILNEKYSTIVASFPAKSATKRYISSNFLPASRER